jgi:hypothetical protein
MYATWPLVQAYVHQLLTRTSMFIATLKVNHAMINLIGIDCVAEINILQISKLRAYHIVKKFLFCYQFIFYTTIS